LLPEQVWDEADRPERSLRMGQPVGSAVPLAWAHAEYLKLLRSAVDGKVFDRIDPVYERYCEPEGRKKCRRGVEITSRMRPIQRMDAGSTLRILDERLFDVVWTDDGWKTVNRASSRGLGSAGFSANVMTAAGTSELEWTMHWQESESWLGYNVKVKVDAA
jgi:glucoamylase